ncbi:Thiol-disulfide isomerase or thioredoxin [Chitinophaga sp. YR627]|uniref:TlpA disulfide reductase family protein n=1 Tax=Chitinophaga sp. YR627 TaxID=1881041 RepID=UPI0008EC0F21|nr:TlpA disulfide reductase family protein [Chitinophaga sp. YR627]SFN32911.1 Thiol-disulfide isomerase or thioredoxin [Chitinophaga sp. YR627]
MPINVHHRQFIPYKLFSTLIVLLFCSFISVSYAQEKFIIRGTSLNYKGRIYLDWNDHIDTVLIKDNKFQFEGTSPRIMNTRLFVDSDLPVESNWLYLESGETKITIDTTTITSLGTDKAACMVNIHFTKAGPINEVLSLHEKKFRALVPRYIHASEAEQFQFAVSMTRDQFREYPESLAPLFYLVSTGTKDFLPPSLLDSIYRQLPERYRATVYGEAVKKRLEYYERTTAGQAIKNFKALNAAGDSISTAGFKGKYLLVDLWASWCAPCREEIPLLKELYEQYKGNRFALLGVSIDRDWADWLKAVEKEQLPWVNAIDPRHFDAEIYRYFRANAVPFNLLLDPEGKVVAVDLHGEALRNKLAEVLKQ